MQVRHVDVLDRSSLTGTNTFLAAVTGFRVPDDHMAMPYNVNFSKHQPRADFDAVPAGVTVLGIQTDEIGFSFVRQFVRIHIVHFHRLGGQVTLSTQSVVISGSLREPCPNQGWRAHGDAFQRTSAGRLRPMDRSAPLGHVSYTACPSAGPRSCGAARRKP